MRPCRSRGQGQVWGAGLFAVARFGQLEIDALRTSHASRLRDDPVSESAPLSGNALAHVGDACSTLRSSAPRVPTPRVTPQARTRLKEPIRNRSDLWVPAVAREHQRRGSVTASPAPPRDCTVADARAIRFYLRARARPCHLGLEGACPRTGHPDVRVGSFALATRVTSRVTRPVPLRARAQNSLRALVQRLAAQLRRRALRDSPHRFARLRAGFARHREKLRPVRARPRVPFSPLSQAFGRRGR